MGVLQSVPGQYLRAKVDSGVQSRVYMCSQLWKSAGTNGQNFSVCRCRPKWPARSSITGLRCRLSAAQQKPSSIRLSPWPPRFPGPLRHPPRASPSLVQVWRHFATFFLACWGVPAPKGQNYGATAVGRRSLVMKSNTGGGPGCFGRRPTWDRKQRWMRDECNENPTVDSMP